EPPGGTVPIRKSLPPCISQRGQSSGRPSLSPSNPTETNLLVTSGSVVFFIECYARATARHEWRGPEDVEMQAGCATLRPLQAAGSALSCHQNLHHGLAAGLAP